MLNASFTPLLIRLNDPFPSVKSVYKTNVAFNPDLLSTVSHPQQQITIDWRAVEINYSGDPAHAETSMMP